MQEKLFEFMLANWPTAFVLIGRDGIIKLANERWRCIAAEINAPHAFVEGLGIECKALLAEPGLMPPQAYRALQDVLEGRRADFRLDHQFPAPGPDRWHLIRIARLGDEGAIFMHVDITERKMVELAIHEIATRDTLTQTYNRASILDRMERLLEDTQRSPWTVIVADINNLKLVNDTMGHLEGDRAIRMVADSLQQMDAEVGRLGGDEFLALLPNTSPVRSDDYRAAVEYNLSLLVPDQSYSVALGMAYVPLDGTSMIELLSAADRKMYRSKRLQLTFRPRAS